jgi:NAD(P)-dependent dehydrogenase (short-subunit alcohol dehydrogenase family)
MNFSGKVALITGAAVGLGYAVAVTFAEMGADLILLDMNEEGLKAVKADCEQKGVKVLTYTCDISNEQDVYAVVDEAEKEFGKIDFLINNAAVWRDTGPFMEVSTDLWKKYFDINVFGTVYVTRAVLRGMLNREYGKIVNIASVAGHFGNQGMVHYSATKGAVIAMSAALSKEVVNNGINVNCVSPGTISPVPDGDMNYHYETPLCRLGRTGTGTENASLIAYLCTDEARYIVGQNILIDGGRKMI